LGQPNTPHIPASFCGHPTTPLPLSQIDHYLPQCHLIINTLSINIFDLHTNPFGPSQTIFDASYATRPLARQAAEAGATYIGGERWLIHQAIPSFIAMTGIEPDISSMESCLYQKYSLI
jgi:shikimate 5-dehydrogenase